MTCKLLAHRFPRVRRYTAENFYVQLLDRADLVGSSSVDDDWTTVLLDSQWDKDLSTRQILEMTTKVASKLGISLFFIKDSDSSLENPATTNHRDFPDEFASYAALALSVNHSSLK